MALDRELAKYREELPRLIHSGTGRFVLIGGDRVSVWDTYADAIQEGYRQFGLEPFLVKQIQLVEPVHHITREFTPVCPS
jgi:hypothetical protein